VVKPVTAVEANIVSITIENSAHLVIDNIDSDQTVAQFDNWHVCDSNDLTVRNSEFMGGEDGIDFNTDLTTALIENNSFIDINTGNGDEVLDFTDGTYADVVIQDNLFKNNYRHITINPPFGNQATNFIIRRNFMDGTNSQEGVRFNDGGGALDNILLENNVIANSTQQGLYVAPPVENITVQNNTFFNNGKEEIRLREAADAVFLMNNIIYANGTHAAISASSGFAPGPLPSEDYNLIFNQGSGTESGSEVPITTFGSNTITGSDPLFVSVTPGSEDFHLQVGSPAIEAGTDLGVSDDIEKSIRPNPAGTDPDIGAYEMGSFDDEGPITTQTTADPNPVAVNGIVTLTANVDDTTTGGSDIASAEYSLDGGTWIEMDATDGTFDEVSEDVTASFTAPAEAGIYDLCVRGTDAAGNTGAAECIMLVVYDPDGGFVTGGGWIESPVGAYLPGPSGTIIIAPENMNDLGWFFWSEGANSSGSLVSGPETPPLGVGSVNLTVDDTGRHVLAGLGHAGTRLDEIDALTYSTYQSIENTGFDGLAISLQLDIDYDLTDADTGWQGRLVFEPYYTNTVSGGIWQNWDALSGEWWSSGSPGNTYCPISNPCTWDEVLTNFPDAGIRDAGPGTGFIVLKAGGPWAGGFDGNADAPRCNYKWRDQNLRFRTFSGSYWQSQLRLRLQVQEGRFCADRKHRIRLQIC
jgi:parallel beta-helix repeat protein